MKDDDVQNVPSSPPPEFLGFFLESAWGTGHCWAMKFLSWFQTRPMWGIENRDIKLSPHPIPAKWENMFEQGPVSMFWQDTWKSGKSGTYILTDGGGILKPKWNYTQIRPLQALHGRRGIKGWCFDGTDGARQRMLGGGRINNPGQTLPLSFYLLHPGKHKLSEQMFWPPKF